MQDVSRQRETVVCSLGITLIIGLLVLRGFLQESLWLDETITAWVTSESLSEAFGRAQQYQGQSPLYYVLLWCWTQVFGVSELALRAPSLLLVLAALAVCFVWLRRKVGLLPAALAVVVLLAIDPLILALSARPYAAGLFSIVMSLFCFDRGLEENNPRQLWKGAAWLALGCYFHFLFAFAGILVLLRAGPSLKRVLLPLTLAGVFCLPLLPQFFSLAARHDSLLFVDPPSFREGLSVLFPMPLLVQLLMAMGAVLILSGSKNPLKHGDPRETLSSCRWVIGWWLLPTVFLWLCAHWGVGAFVDRYVIYTFPAVAVLVALAAERWLSKRSQLTLFCAFTLLVAGRYIERTWKIEDWRGGFRALQLGENCARPEQQVLVYSGLVELEQQSWRANRDMWSYLNAPASVYGQGLSFIPIGLSSDFSKEISNREAVCGLILLRRSVPLQIAPFQKVPSRQGGSSSEELIVSSLKEIGLELEPISAKGEVVAVYRVSAHPVEAAEGK